MFAAAHIPYEQTNAFSKIVLDYLGGSADLKPFYRHAPTRDGLRQALEARSKRPIDRAALVHVLRDQYRGVDAPAVLRNIDALSAPQTFTVCTAHQPTLATGPLYVIYKILHAVRLASELNRTWPDHHFVPAYYMGSEDADIAELNHFTVDGKKYEWKTDQAGAVGRMTIDKTLTALFDELHRQIGVEEHGPAIVDLLKTHYRVGHTVQDATFGFVNALFGHLGLVILIADHPQLKKQMSAVFSDDLFNHKPSLIVTETCAKLDSLYKVQAHPREINLFYLAGDVRERIERKGQGFCVRNTNISFTEDELRKELEDHPGRFSPNVILRGLFQETILPNIAFIGGGGELAYWLQLADLFDAYNTPFPVLLLRNSMLLIEKGNRSLLDKPGLSTGQLFQSPFELVNERIKQSGQAPALNGELDGLNAVYATLEQRASQTDPTLALHVRALQAKAQNDLQALEKKMLRSARKKEEAYHRQVLKMKEVLFPGNGLQERVENIAGFYARHGKKIIDELYEESLAIDPAFTILIDPS
jgi:bacillithiol biosynthesis cysteine-adding enzyme BshC